jgi:hypothetical protein
METHRFVTYNESNVTWSEPIGEQIGDLFMNIILKEFTWFKESAFFLAEIFNGEKNGELIGQCLVERSTTVPYEINNNYDTGDFLEAYISHRNTILANLTKDLIPGVNEKWMIEAKLSPDKYVVRVSNIDMKVSTNTINDGEENVFVIERVVIMLTFSVEDITTLQPGQPQALQARYNFLCGGSNLAATEELRQWARDIGFPRADISSKQQLCLFISNYYGFL